MNELVEFLLARIADDEAVACEALSRSSYGFADSAFEEAVELAQGEGARAPALAHIARWDPARALAEVESKRQVVNLWRRETTGLNEDEIAFAMSMSEYLSGVLTVLSATLRRLALPYAGHKDYRPEWKP